MQETSTTSRTLQLLSLLQTHKYWVGSDLARRLDVSPRTLRRDIERLRDLGYRVSASRGADGGYQLEAGADLPPLVFTDEEAVTLAVSLRTAAAAGTVGSISDLNVAVLAKLEQVLPSRLRRRVNALAEATVPAFGPSRIPAVETELLAVLALSCRDSEQLRIKYTAAGGTETTRRIEPLKLVPYGRRWYLVCWDLDRDDWRTLRLDRIRDVLQTGARFTPRELPTADAAEFVRRQLGSIGTRHIASVLIAAPYDEVVAQLGSYTSGLGDDGSGNTLWEIESQYLEVLASNLVWLPWDFKIVGSPEFVNHMRAYSTRLSHSL